MALIVTPGAPDADAFVSLDDCDAYCTAQGLLGWTEAARSPTEDDEAAIRRATSWLSNSLTWKGAKTNGRAQALAWPRVGVIDEEGEDVPSNEVPIEIVQACCIAAAYERTNPGGLTPTVNLSNQVKSKGVGPLRKEYFAPAMSAEAAKPILTRVTDLVSGLVAGGTSSIVGRAVRI